MLLTYILINIIHRPKDFCRWPFDNRQCAIDENIFEKMLNKKKDLERATDLCVSKKEKAAK